MKVTNDDKIKRRYYRNAEYCKKKMAKQEEEWVKMAKADLHWLELNKI